MTAQEAFAALVKDHLGPALRRLGWRGTGANWTRPHVTHWVLLNWQKSRYSTAESVSFTANLAVISKDAWDAENVPVGRRPSRPTSSSRWGVGWEHRIGHFMPDAHGDHWWSLRQGAELDALAREVAHVIVTYALPAVEQELARAAGQPHVCWHNVGGRSWFQACGRPGDVDVPLADRVLFRCADHAEVPLGR